MIEIFKIFLKIEFFSRLKVYNENWFEPLDREKNSLSDGIRMNFFVKCLHHKKLKKHFSGKVALKFYLLSQIWSYRPEIFFFIFHFIYIIICSEQFFVFFLVRKKIVFFEKIYVKIYSFVAKLYQKMRFFLFGTYYYAHEMKNKKWKSQVDKIKFDGVDRILRRLSQKKKLKIKKIDFCKIQKKFF
jgi:hypothetical protein